MMIQESLEVHFNTTLLLDNCGILIRFMQGIFSTAIICCIGWMNNGE